MTNNENFFEITLIKPNNTFEKIKYKKECEKFIEDFAIVKAYSKDIKYSNHTWYGIINKNYETIVPFKIRDKVDLFKTQVLLQESTLDKDCTKHLDLTNQKEELINVIGKYKKVNDEVVITEFPRKYNSGVFLYNVLKGEVVSNLFDEIGPFQEINGKYLALTTRSLKQTGWDMLFNKNFNFPKVRCYIDLNGNIISFDADLQKWYLNGNICSLVHNPLTNEYEQVQKEEFELYIKTLTKSIIDYLFPTKEEVIIKNLKKVLLPK